MNLVSRETLISTPRGLTSPIRSGDIFFCSGDSLLSRAIEGVTQSPVSHCGILWRNYAWDQILCLEAVLNYGVRISPLEKYTSLVQGKLPDGPVYIARYTGDIYFQKALAAGAKLLTDPYSLYECFHMAMRLLFGVGRRSNSKGWICSELVDHCLRQSGHIIPSQHGFVTPGDVWADPALTLIGRVA